MIINPTVRNNFFTNAHPEGCKRSVEKQIIDIKNLGPFKGPRNVLIIGGSSGYGLASRISLAFGSNAHTVNVSFESEPRGKRTGSAGYWNNVFFQHYAKETGNKHKDFLGDAFSVETKQQVIDYIKRELGSVDLIIYSLASGVRKNYQTGETIRSQIKTLGESISGKTIDVGSLEVLELEVLPATAQETEDTVFVMGGSDWQDWVELLDSQHVLAEGVKTIAYTYIGGETTGAIYRRGTLGKAKEDLEHKAQEMNLLLQNKYNGEALISSSKAVVSKASVFIPQMPIYVACLYNVMKAHNVHETIHEHKYRLFKDMVYGSSRLVDEQGRIRLDHLEMDPTIQKETLNLMMSYNNKDVFKLQGTTDFLQEFYEINGFQVEGINYDQDVDIEQFILDYVPTDY